MSLASQVLPLVGVATGAVLSLVVSAVNERTQWRRQQSVRWDERRLNAYAEYAHTVKELSNRYRGLAIARGLTTGSTPLEPTAATLEELAAAEAHRSALAEALWLLGDVDSNTAAVQLNRALWHLEWLARGRPTAGTATWPEAYLEFRKTREDFLRAARRDLGVSGGQITRDVPWPPQWHPSSDTGVGNP
ncbi:hypothetical protein GCM10009837_38890 [Streptomyces durmitorensis]|uniref:Secreted protein n=1 Tax=Streptomyces durmitorensis TaxID=319947 RepID=A0ABY4Q5Q1_9ACTN|nr:hypothetical protein [Streptomyces durmitorensis]UQT61046.1 hypothetical protein M4V62_41570 [Streptomyces durmitorensis]